MHWFDYYTQHKLLPTQDGSYTYRRDKTGAALMVITCLAKVSYNNDKEGQSAVL